MNHIVKPVIILTLTVFCSALFLSYTRKITAAYILSQEIDKQKQAVSLVLAGYKIGEELIAKFDDDTKFSYWIGTKIEDDIEKKGYAFISTVHGDKREIAAPPKAAWQYNFISTVHGNKGEIKAMIGVDEDDKILEISIIHQPEMPIAFFATDIKETIVNDIKDSLIKLKKARSIIEHEQSLIEQSEQ